MGRKKKRQQKKQQQRDAENAALGASPAGAAETGAAGDDDGDDDGTGDDAGGDEGDASAAPQTGAAPGQPATPPAPTGDAATTTPAVPTTPAAPTTPAPAPLPVAGPPEVVGSAVPATAPGDGAKPDAPAEASPTGWPRTLGAFLDDQLQLTPLYVYALIAAVVFCVYANSLWVPFLFDDAPVITRNRLFHDLSLANTKKIVENHPLRCIPNLSFYVNYHVQGTPAYQYGSGPYAGTYGPNWTYHVFNMALHAVNGVLLFLLLKTLLAGSGANKPAMRLTQQRRQAQKKGGDVPLSSEDTLTPLAEWIALGGALLWVVHPIQTMAVTYITQRYALFAAFGTFGSLWCYATLRRRMESGTAWLNANWWTTFLYMVLVLPFWIIGCLSKENAAIVPWLFPIMELCFFSSTANDTSKQPLLLEVFDPAWRRWLLAFSLTPLFFLALYYRYTKVGLDDLIPSSAPTFPDRMSYFRTEWVVLLKYLKLYAWPTDLAVEQAFPPLNWTMTDPHNPGNPYSPNTVVNWDHTFNMLRALVGHALIFALGGLWYFTGRRFLAFCVAWYYMTQAIESSILPILDPMVEHRMYIPSAFLAAGLAFSVAKGAANIWSYGPDWTRDFAARFAGTASGVADWTARTLEPWRARVHEQRHQIARNIVILWATLLVLFGIGTHIRNRVWSNSLKIWEDTIEKRPDCARAYSSLGMEMLYNGDWIAAVEPIETALCLGPYHVEGWNNIGKAYLELGSGIPNHVNADPKKASVFPSPLLLWAEETLKRGIEVDRVAPSPSVPLCWNNLGLTYMKMAERVAKLNDQEELRYYKMASEALTEATRLDPGYDTAWINLGTSYVRRCEKLPKGHERRMVALQAVNSIKSSNAGKYYRHQLFTHAALNIALAAKYAEHHAESFQYLDYHHRKCVEERIEDAKVAAMSMYAEEGSQLCEILMLLPPALAEQEESLSLARDPQIRKDLMESIADIKGELDLARRIQKEGRLLAAAEVFLAEAEVLKADAKMHAKYLRYAAKLTWFGGGQGARAQQLYDLAINALPPGDEQRRTIENEKSLFLSRPQPVPGK